MRYFSGFTRETQCIDCPESLEQKVSMKNVGQEAKKIMALRMRMASHREESNGMETLEWASLHVSANLWRMYHRTGQSNHGTGI
jgi:hypothetical protein